jgi:hypothetical protein
MHETPEAARAFRERLERSVDAWREAALAANPQDATLLITNALCNVLVAFAHNGMIPDEHGAPVGYVTLAREWIYGEGDKNGKDTSPLERYTFSFTWRGRKDLP